MSPQLKYVLLAGLAVAGGSIVATAQRRPFIQQGSAPANTISVKSFNQAKVIGLLGRPLGTIVRATGVVIDGDSTTLKRDLGKTLLKVETVDGTPLADPPLFDLGRAAKDVKKPAAGEQFDFYIHEYGAFDGVVDIPKHLKINSVPIASDGFHYHPEITIHASNPVAAKK